MRVSLDCYPCFFTQALKTSRLITSDEKKIWEILNEVSLSILKIPFGVTPSEIGREVYRMISQITGIKDPYKEIKEDSTRQALSLYPEMRKLIDSSEDRLMTAVRLSIAGNVIDFGANASFNLENDIETILSQDFSINHYSEFCRALNGAQRILYVADNAGETVFDRVLIEILEQPVIYAVKGGPTLNDATQEDAVAAGLGEVAEIVSTGSDAPGTVLKSCSPAFRQLYDQAELIIAKGQANHEALGEGDRRLFFLLQVKCPVLGREVGAEPASIILKQG